MVKIIFLITCLIAALGGSSTSSNIKCLYDVSSSYSVVGVIYQCKVNNNPNIIKKESAENSEIFGSHQSSKSNDDVLGIFADDKTIQFFPKGLDKFFKNLKMIRISYCQLKEIHQSDLKVFPKLVYLGLYNNEIEVIEEGLFDFNSNLEVVGFWESRIIHIDPNVFDHLTKLRYFWFSPVFCFNLEDIYDSKGKVLEAIKVVKSNCSSLEFLSLENQIKNLEIESKTLNSEDFHTKLERFEKSFNKSKFSKFRPFNYKFEILKNESCSNCRQLTKNVSLDKKLTLFNENIKNNFDDGQKKIDKSFEDLKLTQCGLKSNFIDLKASQNSLQTTLNAIKSSAEGQGSKLDQMQNFQTQMKDSISSSINNVFTKVSEVSSSQETMKTSLNQIEVKVNDLTFSQDQIKSTQGTTVATLNDLGSKITKIQESNTQFSSIQSDTVTAIENLKNTQATFESSLNSVKTTQEDAKLSQKNIKSSQDNLKLSIEKLLQSVDDLMTKFNEHKIATESSIKNIEASLRGMETKQEEVNGSLKNMEYVVKVLRKAEMNRKY